MYSQFSVLGFRVVEAQNGHEALEMAFGRRQLIVMDLSLPPRRLGGTRLKATIAPGHPHHRLTGHALAGHSKGAMDAGCDAFITKPCLPERLLEEIKSMLKG